MTPSTRPSPLGARRGLSAGRRWLPMAAAVTALLTIAGPLAAHDAAHDTPRPAAGGDHAGAAQPVGGHAHGMDGQASDSHDHHDGSHEGGHQMQAASRLAAGASLIEARRLYLDRCSGCHGKRGEGGAGGVGFSEPEALIRLTRDRIEDAIAGSHGGRVDPPLAPDEAAAVAGYVRDYLMLPAPDADTDIGRAIYARSCSVCHGDRGDGASWARNSLNPPPADFSSHSLEQLSREEMIHVVTFGSDRTAMMPFAVQLSPEEIAATVDYIRTAFMKEAGEAADGGHESHDRAGHDHGGHDHGGHDHGRGEGDPDAYPGGLVPDVAWGEAFYKANCAECHGKNGDGEGPRAYFMVVKPANFRSEGARYELTRAKLFKYIANGVQGATMPSWKRVLSDQQIANVAEYVYRTFLHPDEFAQPGSALRWEPSGAAGGEDGTELQGTKKN